MGTTRRQFVRTTALGFGAYLLVGAGACKRGAPQPALVPLGGLRSLTQDQYALLVAACERILPRDEDPGATDLGCAEYIDRAMADPEARAMWGRALFGGLPVLEKQARARYGKPFAECAVEQQEELLALWQQSRHSGEAAFFEVLHTLTLEGAFGDPVHGGNREGRGFALVGFTPHMPLPGGHEMALPGAHEH